MKEKHPQNLTGTAANHTDIAGNQHKGEKGEEQPQIAKSSEKSLLAALQKHKQAERASFHTPGHKGRLDTIFQTESSTDSALDLTELPGLDSLSQPQGILADTAAAASSLYGAGATFLSVNGASAAITAAILAASPRGDSILVPRNAHRSVLDAICLTGLTPIWYQPTWNRHWALWDESTVEAIETALNEALEQEKKAGSQSRKIALAVVVSPTYGGALSDIKALAQALHKRGIPLLVDEAHGAHHIEGSITPGALAAGADLVAQSLHKTLTGLTQTGLLHVGKDSLIEASAAAEAMQRLTSTSPSYLLMASIDQTIRYLSTTAGIEHLFRLSGLKAELEARLTARGFQIYRTAFGTTETHLVVGYGNDSPSLIYDFLVERGVFPEAILGRGVLFMLGLGTNEADLLLLVELLCQYASLREKEPGSTGEFDKESQTPDFLIAMPPHQAIMSAKTTALDKQALNRVSAQFLAPCPPGIPLLIPGQVITEEVLASSKDKQFIVVA